MSDTASSWLSDFAEGTVRRWIPRRQGTAATPRGVFIHVPKCAGSSMMDLLKRYQVAVVLHDARTLRRRVSRYRQLLRHWQGTRRFAFVRSPFARIVSSFFYLNGGGNGPADQADAERFVIPYHGDFRAFCRTELTRRLVLRQTHFRPQRRWLSHPWGTLLVDRIGRVETIDSDWAAMLSWLEIPFEPLPHINTSVHGPTADYYDAATRAIVAQAYAEDFTAFGYDPHRIEAGD